MCPVVLGVRSLNLARVTGDNFPVTGKFGGEIAHVFWCGRVTLCVFL